MPPEEADDETRVLRAIAEPRRRAILRLVADGELTAGQIADAFDVSRPAVSQHLTVLKEAGVIAERREGTRRMYRARPQGLAALRSLLAEFPERGASGDPDARTTASTEKTGVTDGA
ncbi:MAG TPA: metalloregulator ArsR/SmtB family transcription factor [Gryllotalpicola sp.]